MKYSGVHLYLVIIFLHLKDINLYFFFHFQPYHRSNFGQFFEKKKSHLKCPRNRLKFFRKRPHRILHTDGMKVSTNFGDNPIVQSSSSEKWMLPLENLAVFTRGDSEFDIMIQITSFRR